MALTTHTVTLRTEYPGGDPLDGTWSTSVYATPPLVKDLDGHVVIAGKDPEPTIEGTGELVLTLEATGQPDLDPPDFLWQISFVSRDRATRLGPYVFDLTEDRTLDDIAESTGMPITPTLLSQAVDARDAAQAAEAAAEAAQAAAEAAAAPAAVAFVRRYGAPAGSGADNAAAIQAELTTYGRATLRPNTTYPCTGFTVPAGTILDTNGATIAKHSGTANLVTLGAGARLVDGILDLNALAGAGVRITSAADVYLGGVTVIDGAGSVGFDCNAAVRPVLEDCSSDGVKYAVLLNGGTSDAKVRGGTHRNGTSTEVYSGSVYIPNGVKALLQGVTVIDAAGHGFWIGGAAVADIRVESSEARSCGTAGDLRGATIGSSATRVKFVDCDFIDNYEAGAYVDATGTEVDFTDCRSRGNNTGLRPGGMGFEHLGTGKLLSCRASGQLGNAANAGGGYFAGATSGGKSFTDCWAVGNYSAGFRLYNSVNVEVVACKAKNNSQRGVALHDGIEVNAVAGTSTDVQLIGNRAWDDQATKTQRFGINVVNASVDYYTATGNNTRGNASTGFNDAGGANKAVANNL